MHFVGSVPASPVQAALAAAQSHTDEESSTLRYFPPGFVGEDADVGGPEPSSSA